MKTCTWLAAAFIILFQLSTLQGQGQCSCSKKLSLLNEISTGYSKTGLILNEGLGVLIPQSGISLTAGISMQDESRHPVKTAPTSQASIVPYLKPMVRVFASGDMRYYLALSYATDHQVTGYYYIMRRLDDRIMAGLNIFVSNRNYGANLGLMIAM